MNKRKIAFALGLFLLPIGQPIYLGTASIFTSPDAIYSLSAKAETKNAQFYYERGVKKSDKGIYKGAISDYTKAIEINPDYEDAYYQRGFAKESIKDYKGAISDYTKVTKLNQDAWDAYYGRGYSQWQLGKNKAALSDFEKAIEINPEDGYIYLDRSSLREEIEDYKGAVSDNNRALKIFSKDKVQLSIKNIIAPAMMNKRNSPMYKGFNKYAKFNGQTYQKPITYYIHEKGGKFKSKIIPKSFKKYSYEISEDAQKFIDNTFSKLDPLIDLDFKRVYSPSEAIIRIYQTDDWDGSAGTMWEDLDSPNYYVEVYFSDNKYKYLKMKNFPNLSVDSAFTIVHEIGHALGLEHFSGGSLSQYTKFNIDPEDVRINARDTTMSYNRFMYADEANFFTELDIKALRQVWGVEKNN